MRQLRCEDIGTVVHLTHTSVDGPLTALGFEEPSYLGVFLHILRSTPKEGYSVCCGCGCASTLQ